MDDLVKKILGIVAPPVGGGKADKNVTSYPQVVEQNKAHHIAQAIRSLRPESKSSDQELYSLYQKYGDKLLAQKPAPTNQGVLGAAIQGAQNLFNGQAKAQAPVPMPTPSDSQFSNKLAELQNDPGSQYNDVITKAGTEEGVPMALLKSVLARESMQFDPKYVHGMHTDQHGMGIAGIDDRAHPEINKEQAFDPNFAIPYAARLLSGYHKQQGDWGKALRYYNGGGNYASKEPGFQGVPIDQRTMDYLMNVYKQSKHFSGQE